MSEPRFNKRYTPEHMTPDGDKVVCAITIKVYSSGALSVEYPTHEPAWSLAVLENAKDAIKGNNRPDGLFVPAKDVSLP